MKAKIRLLLLISFMVLLLACNEETVDHEITILPLPALIEQKSGSFEFDESVSIHITKDSLLIGLGEYLQDMISGAFASKPMIDNYVNSVRGIILELLEDENAVVGAYKMEITKRRIYISSASAEGLFYGIQTLRQLMPPEIESPGMIEMDKLIVPCLYIEDHPGFSWRGMHLDVSRHFFPIEFIKEYIDLIAMHKMNIFHWHLVDDQGWRIEIKKYPKLTGTGAWRVNREDQPWNARKAQQAGEIATCGGYYTQEEIKEVIEYARKRFVTIVPEIEMPAHVTSALVAYPEYSCTGGPFTVPPGGLWPIRDIYCAGKEETFTFLEDVLSEVLGLFPSEYIHIGGDEADKAEWKKCPDCQARIKSEGLKDEAELQSYFIKRIEKFLASQGRKLIGWDEILEGGLAPGAAVMSWRGMAGGIEAAHSGHYVVMSPGSHCYFDHYQADPSTEPIAIGGFTTLKKVYSFNPIPETLSEEQTKYILGAQANVWTEYMSKGEHVEYMVLPRMTALAEVLWTPIEKRDWLDFSRRVNRFMERLDIMGLNYSLGSLQVEMSAIYDTEQETVMLSITSESPEAIIKFTLDGTDPDNDSETYEHPLKLNETKIVRATAIRKGIPAGKIIEKTVYLHKATGMEVNYLIPFSPKYKSFSELSLVNGIKGSLNFADGQWQGFDGEDLDIIIDLGSVQEISYLSAGFISSVGSWIFLPEYVEFQVSSEGDSYKNIGRVENNIDPRQQDREIKNFEIETDPVQAQYIKVLGKNIGICPSWHDGAGGKTWIFADEIIVK